VTLPKITARSQVSALVDAFAAIELSHHLGAGALRMELMVETPYSLFDERGAISLPHLVREGRGRIVAAHFGTYDYTASLGITAAHQHMRHQVCDFARGVMQVALANTDTSPLGQERPRLSWVSRITPLSKKSVCRTGTSTRLHSEFHLATNSPTSLQLSALPK